MSKRLAQSPALLLKNVLLLVRRQTRARSVFRPGDGVLIHSFHPSGPQMQPSSSGSLFLRLQIECREWTTVDAAPGGCWRPRSNRCPGRKPGPDAFFDDLSCARVMVLMRAVRRRSGTPHIASLAIRFPQPARRNWRRSNL
jgi:hypothetical protein